LKSALSAKAAAGDIIVIDNLELSGIKTKEFVNFLKALEVPGKALVVTPEVRENVVKSARNIQGVKTTTATIINVYDILNHDKFIVDKEAVLKIQEVFK
jgi:large subunit ribosomal protein L4